MDRRNAIKTIGIATTGLVAGQVMLGAQVDTAPAGATTPNRPLAYPLIHGYGGIVVLPQAAEQPRQGSRVLLDITSDKTAGSVIKGLDRAALFCNLYAQAEAGPAQGLRMAVILHGAATKAALSHAAYARHLAPATSDITVAKNPNLDLIGQLRKAGVDIFVCGQAMVYNGYEFEDLVTDVTVVVSAAVLNINRQADGYAYVPFH